MNQIFQYNGSPITFKKGDSVMVNATEMAKPFGKKPVEWLSNNQTQEFINSLSAKVEIPTLELVLTQRGGNNPGTWLHEDLALIFAQWLSPDFYLWCNDRIKELLLNGSVSIDNGMQSALQQQLEAANEKIYSLTAELNYLRGRIDAEKELAVVKSRMEMQEELTETKLRLKMAMEENGKSPKGGNVSCGLEKAVTEEGTQNPKPQKSKEPEYKEYMEYRTGRNDDEPIGEADRMVKPIIEPDYARSCKLQNKKDVQKHYPGAMLVGEMSRRIKEEHGIYVKSSDIFAWLIDNGFLLSDNVEIHKPSDYSMKNRWIVYVRSWKKKEKGVADIRRYVPYITADGYKILKGLMLIRELNNEPQ